MSDESNRWIEQEIDELFNGQTTITKEEMKKALEDHRMGRPGGRGRGGMDHLGPMQDEMKQKLGQLLESELNKINSDTITKEQAKSVLLSLRPQAKEQWRAQMDQHVQSSIKNELTKLNASEVNSGQARDLLRNISHQMRPSHGGGPSMIDDNMKNEFLAEYKAKHGTNKIGVDEVWDIVKSFDKKQHEKMGCCERNSDWEKEKDNKWEKVFNEQYKELFGDVEKTKVNQQQLEQLAKNVKEKLRADYPQHPGKRFCQH